jgi:hypothetical protein
MNRHMIMKKAATRLYHRTQLVYFFLIAVLSSCTSAPPPAGAKHSTSSELARQMQVGDIVFIRIPFYLFTRVAEDTGSWTNHVGIVTEADGENVIISESTFPFSGSTPLPNFIARSERGRIAVTRLKKPLSEEAQQAMIAATGKRNGLFYDSGFNLHSKRQFCSRYVHESLKEATGIEVGEITTLHALLQENPQAKLTFWKIWYFGAIPWQRQTITPASMLESPLLYSVYDGYAKRV